MRLWVQTAASTGSQSRVAQTQLATSDRFPALLLRRHMPQDTRAVPLLFPPSIFHCFDVAPEAAHARVNLLDVLDGPLH